MRAEAAGQLLASTQQTAAAQQQRAEAAKEARHGAEAAKEAAEGHLGEAQRRIDALEAGLSQTRQRAGAAGQHLGEAQRADRGARSGAITHPAAGRMPPVGKHHRAAAESSLTLLVVSPDHNQDDLSASPRPRCALTPIFSTVCFPRRGETTILKCRVAVPEVLAAVMVTG